MGLFFSDDTEDDGEEKYKSDTDISEEDVLLIDESREVIQNQIEVIKHQREMASSVLRLCVTLLIIVIGSLLSLFVFRLDTVLEVVSNVTKDIDDPIAIKLINIGAAFVVFFILSLLFFLIFFLRDSLRILRERAEWDLDTLPNPTTDRKIEKLRQSHENLIDKNEKSINKNEPRLTEIADTSILFLTSFLIFGSLFVLVYFMHQDGAISDEQAVPLALFLIFGYLIAPIIWQWFKE